MEGVVQRGAEMDRGVEGELRTCERSLRVLRERVKVWRKEAEWVGVYCERCTHLWRDDGVRFRSEWVWLDSEDDEDMVGGFGVDGSGRDGMGGKKKRFERRFVKYDAEEDMRGE